MGAADLNTKITMKGTEEELFSLIKVIRSFENEKHEQYNTKHDCGYLDSCRLIAGEDNFSNMFSDGISLEKQSDEDIKSLISTANGKISVTAEGPYGVFAELSENGLFAEMARAAPSAYFKGVSYGFVTGEDVSLTGELKEGILYLEEYSMPDDVIPKLYLDEIEKVLPHSEFCSLFKVDEDEFDDCCYSDFITEICYEGFPEADYKVFLKYRVPSEIDEEGYEKAIETLRGKKIINMNDFSDSIYDEYTERWTYDPVKKKYTREDNEDN
jgi:hypothetical protein